MFCLESCIRMVFTLHNIMVALSQRVFYPPWRLPPLRRTAILSPLGQHGEPLRQLSVGLPVPANSPARHAIDVLPNSSCDERWLRLTGVL